MWIKGNERIDGRHLIWEDEQGNEFETWNPTEDFLIEQGWTKEEEVEVDEQGLGPTLRQIKDSLLQEHNEFYKSSILKFNFQGDLIWIPAETRVAYKSILEDVKSEDYEQVEYRNRKISISDALDALKMLNVYEFVCREVRDQHTKNIIEALIPESLELYDYTVGYPERIDLSKISF